MRLHENKELLQDAIQAAAQQFEIREIYVEKDYWVTVALYHVFHSEVASQAVFKGGTALSKCHKLVERFSEDIDLVVLKNQGETDNQLKRKIRSVSKSVEKILPEIQVDGLTNKLGQIRKTVHRYDKIFDGDFGQAREHIVLEATWLGNADPYTNKPVSCYITEMLKSRGEEDVIAEYQMAPFEVQVLSEERTFCEKIMSLVRFSRTETAIEDLKKKIRHVYDLHLMLNNEAIANFIEGDEFEAMLVQVGKDDIVSFKNNNDWVYTHPSEAIIFAEPEKTWESIKVTYQTSFKEFVTGVLPREEAVIKSLQTLSDRIKKVKWGLYNE
ncbi:nucleotidyl transferase AbiEii/AbiGii toxin family protein [Pontibacter sp. Tf4]|uniref:nucleotidyl transferase AbiEii/AbiGii toxin family protein n=1 Tax=Pontibacter sp. Tf4 TaxID=2761620 RepID=UPI001625A7CF|nr:nucleotidyl transferase AbiEii/AbiGii toxin family protein [Pontibacter sp. Tf4]MBB6611752.1 nucleotidyl transferase AbiEii/AbiGii toxin family protein [Pontibacter sp. Tf4]